MCKQTDQEIASKMQLAYTNVNIEILSAFIMIIFSYFATKWTKALSKNYDERNVSPSDYTLFFKLDP
jgi:hypothetical protein